MYGCSPKREKKYKALQHFRILLLRFRAVGTRAGQKIEGKGGETLVEVLCAILIISLTSAILMGGIITASKLNGIAKDREAAYQTQCNNAEIVGSEPGTAEISGVTVNDAANSTVQVPVTYNTSDSDVMRSYHWNVTP